MAKSYIFAGDDNTEHHTGIPVCFFAGDPGLRSHKGSGKHLIPAGEGNFTATDEHPACRPRALLPGR